MENFITETNVYDEPWFDRAAAYDFVCQAKEVLGLHQREIARRWAKIIDKRHGLEWWTDQETGERVPTRDTGLSTLHIFSLQDYIQPHVTFYENGDLVEVRRGNLKTRFEDPNRKGGRGEVTSFSRKSQKRLRNTLARVDKTEEVPLFVTLTYPDNFPVSGSIWKKHLKNFWMRLSRKYEGVAMVWVLELKARKTGENAGEYAPHFHLLLFGAPNSYEFKKWLSEAWYQVVNSEDEKHLGAGTSVERTRSWRRISGYVAKALKYLSKAEIEEMPDEWHTGRFWGVYGRSNVPWAHSWHMRLTEKEAVKLIRYLRKYAGIKGRDYRSLSVIADSNQWSRRLEWLLYPQ